MKVFKRILFLGIVFVASIFITAMVSADEGGYTVTDWNFSGLYKSNNSVEVTETIKVNFTAPRHGIYRSIPTTMYVKRSTDSGEKRTLKYKSKIEHFDAKDASGAEVLYDKDREGTNTVYRLGDEDRTIEGEYTYVLTYTYVMPDDRVKKDDLIFYSPLGDQTNMSIDHFSFNIKFEKPLTASEVKGMRVYSGAYGDVDNGLGIETKKDATSISGEISNVPPNNAITIYALVRGDYFEGAWVPNKQIVPLVILIITALLALLIILLSVFSRSKKPVETVEFYPPEGMSSAEVGTIIDESVDDVDLMSLIPWWAQQGYITIKETPDKHGRKGEHARLTLFKVKNLPDDAPEFMKRLFYSIFTRDSRCLDDLPRSFSQDFTSAKNLLKNRFTGNMKLSTGHGKAVGLGLLMCLGIFGFITTSSAVAPFENLVLGVIAAIALFALEIGLLKVALAFKNRKSGKNTISIIVGIILVLVAVGCAFLAREDSFFNLLLLIAPVILVAVAILLSYRLIKPTDYKVEMMGKLLGLKNFIKTAEEDKLKMLVAENPEYYYDVLPYAMVFNMSDQWAKQFKNIPTNPPGWYYGYDNMLWNLMFFNMMFRTRIQAPISNIRTEAAMNAVASAASSGFSGGGGGGGGIGSW